MGLEIREMFGIFVGGILAVALLATAVNKNSQTAALADAFTRGFADDIRAATFQSGGGGAAVQAG